MSIYDKVSNNELSFSEAFSKEPGKIKKFYKQFRMI